MTGGKEKTMDMSIVTEGFLYKQGKLVKNWKKRWCCLYPNRLLYYDSKSNADKMKKPLGSFLFFSFLFFSFLFFFFSFFGPPFFSVNLSFFLTFFQGKF